MIESVNYFIDTNGYTVTSIDKESKDIVSFNIKDTQGVEGYLTIRRDPDRADRVALLGLQADSLLNGIKEIIFNNQL